MPQSARIIGVGPSKLSCLPQEDQAVVGEFIGSLGTLSPSRIQKDQSYVGKIGYELGKPLGQGIRPDLIAYLNRINAPAYSEDTKRDIRLIAKKFFRWYRDEDFVKGIRVGNVEGVVGPEISFEADIISFSRVAYPRIRLISFSDRVIGQQPGPFPNCA